MSRTFTVDAGGVRLAVQASGDPARPSVLLVHGYPDNRHVWDGVVERLAGEHHVIAYDVRGCGESDVPRRTRDYHLSRLAVDLRAVADAVSPKRPVHVVGHDWGSIQAWEPVTDPAMAHRIASFTTISGPCMDHVGQWLADLRRERQWRPALGQFRRSWYFFMFKVPGLAPAAWRWRLARLWPAQLRAWEGIDVAPSPSQAHDGANGVSIYRANFPGHVLRPRERRTDIPVQQIVATRDRFIAPELYDLVPRWASRLRRHDVDAGHWLPLSHPGALAGHVRTLVADVEAGRL